MISMFEILSDTKVIIALVATVTEVIERQNLNQWDRKFNHVIQQVRLETLESAKELRDEIDVLLEHPAGHLDVRQGIIPLDVPLDKFRNVALDTDPIKMRKIQKHRNHVGNIRDDLTTSSDHFAAFLACNERTSGLEKAYEVAETVRLELEERHRKQPKLRSILESYIHLLDEYIKRLRT